jgi:hypothetical protein
MTKKDFTTQFIQADISPEEVDFRIAKALEMIINLNENQSHEKQQAKSRAL